MPAKKRDGRNRGQIIARGDGKWLVRVYTGTDAEGKRKYVSETIEGTFKVAEQALTKTLREIDTQSFVAPAKLTVKEYLTSWLAGKQIAVKTRLDYQHRLTKDVYPDIGNVKLTDLSPMRVKTLYADLTTRRKLAPRTVRYTHSILSQAFGQAVAFQMLQRNPCDHQELPKAAHKEEYVILTPAQASLFLEKTSGTKHYPLWLTMLTTGLRPQEVLALEWKHFDAQAKTIKIEQALNEVEKGHYVIGPCKTQTSNRVVALPETTVKVLQGLRKDTGAFAGFLFPGRQGFLDMSAVRLAWKAALKGASMPAVKLHGARHTHISHLVDQGVGMKAIQERAGHSKIGTTMDIYAHLLKDKDQETAGVIEGMLFSPTTKREAM